MFKNLKALAIAICVCAAFASESSAQNLYEFLFSQPTYTAVNPGDTVSATVLLRETVTDGSTPKLAPGGDNGIFFAALNMDFSSVTGGAGSTVTNAAPITFPTVEIELDSAGGGTPGLQVRGTDLDIRVTESLANDLDGGFGISGTQITPSVYEVELFSVEFNAGADGSVTGLRLGDSTEAAERTFFADTVEIDEAATYGTSQIVVGATVPEPGSLLALGALMIGGMLRRRRS